MKALRNIFRMPAQSIILLLANLVLTLTLIFMFFLQGIADSNIKRSIGPLGSCVEATSDSGEVRLTMSQAEKIASGFGIVKTFHARSESLCNMPGLVNFKPKDDQGTVDSSQYPPFTLIATTSTDTLKEFYSDRRTITAGQGISREINDRGTLSVVISEALADLNDLKIGDPINLHVKTVYSPTALECTVYVGGIFYDTIAMANNAAYSYQLPENEIYIPMSVYTHMLSSISEDISLKALYFEMENTSPKAVDALETRLHNIGYYTTSDLRLSTFSPETEAASMAKISKSLDVAIMAVVVCFAITLIGILMWNIQSRTREIGVYCALGVKRRRISLMFVKEALMLIILAFLLATVILSLVSMTYGVELYSTLSSDITGIQSETTVETVLQNEAENNYTEKAFANGYFLILEYLIPATMKTFMCVICLALLVYVVMNKLISRLEVMRVMGGRAG